MLSVYMKQKPPTEKEARSAYIMFQKHRKHIETYEHTFSSQFSEKKSCIKKAPESGAFFVSITPRYRHVPRARQRGGHLW